MPEVNFAALFPGQGAYFKGALVEALEVFPRASDTLAEIDEVSMSFLGSRVSEQLVGSDAKSLDQLLTDDPDLLQLAIYATSVVAYQILRSRDMTPSVLIGHSLGEVAALVSAGAFTVADGAEIICSRIAALNDAGVVDGYMAALSTDVQRAESVLALIGDPDTVVAVENHAAQTVISGRRESVNAALAISATLGISTYTLKSPYPFHCPVLSSAATDFAKRIHKIPQNTLTVDVYSPILGRRYRDSDDLTAELASHLTRRVQFADAIRAVNDEGVDVFVESGALDTLTKTVKRVVDSSAVVARPLLLPTSTIPAMMAGLVGTGGDMQDALRLSLMPGVDRDTFEKFWQSSGQRVIEFARAEFSATPPDALPPALPEPAPPRSTEARSTEARSTEARSTGVNALSRGELLENLTEFYADALEYPAEVFDEKTDLEAELGVDSVKQTELLARVGERFGLPPRPSDFKLTEHNNLGAIADMILAS